MQTSSIIGSLKSPSIYECSDCGKRFVPPFIGGLVISQLRTPSVPTECPNCGSWRIRKLGILDTLSDIADWFSEL